MPQSPKPICYRTLGVLRRVNQSLVKFVNTGFEELKIVPSDAILEKGNTSESLRCRMPPDFRCPNSKYFLSLVIKSWTCSGLVGLFEVGAYTGY